MGVELVKQVAGHPSTSRLSGNAYKVLVAMALQALDGKASKSGLLYIAANPSGQVECPTPTAAEEWCRANGGNRGEAVWWVIEWPPVLPGWSKRGERAA